ncbi:MAG TPA: hypothetical protein PLE57_07150 [Methanoregulaceae archaeon]|nr:hypothetical protein [Methanoregulaceae archaeon]
MKNQELDRLLPFIVRRLRRQMIVLPGVGVFRDGMEQIGEMQQVLTEVAGAVPMLGICLGVQMLIEWSE